MTKIKTVNEQYNIRGDNFTIKVPQCYTADGRNVFNEKVDTIAVNKAFTTYRKRHHMLSPQDIKSIHKSYHDRGVNLANLLGIKKSSLDSYENGALAPSQVENNLEVLNHRKETNYGK